MAGKKYSREQLKKLKKRKNPPPGVLAASSDALSRAAADPHSPSLSSDDVTNTNPSSSSNSAASAADATAPSTPERGVDRSSDTTNNGTPSSSDPAIDAPPFAVPQEAPAVDPSSAAAAAAAVATGTTSAKRDRPISSPPRRHTRRRQQAVPSPSRPPQPAAPPPSGTSTASQPSNGTDDAVVPPSPMDAAASVAAIQDVNRPPSMGHTPSASVNLFASDDVGTGSTGSTDSTGGADVSGSVSARPSPVSEKDPVELKKASDDIFGSGGILGADVAASRKIMAVGLTAFGEGLKDALEKDEFSEAEANVARRVISSLGMSTNALSSVDVASGNTFSGEATPSTAEQRAARMRRRAAANVERAETISDVHSAYSTKKSNKGRKESDNIERNIERAINRDVNRVLDALNEVGDDQKKAKVMFELCSRKDMAAIVKAAGLIIPKDAKARLDMMNQLREFIVAAYDGRSNKRGRLSDDRASAIETIATALVRSVGVDGGPSYQQFADALGMSYPSAQRLVIRARAKREKLTMGVVEMGLWWSTIRQRKRWSKVSDELAKAVVDWLLRHPLIAESPLMKDSISVKNPRTKEVEKVRKRYMMCSIRELHRDLYDEKLGLAEAIGPDGKELISDTRLRSLIPPFFKPMSESVRQVCGCEICIIIERHQSCLNDFRRRQLKKLKEEVDSLPEESEEREEAQSRCDSYLADAFAADGSTRDNKAKDALPRVSCPNVEGFDFPHWKCVLGRLEEGEQIVRNDEDGDEINEE